MKITMVMMFMCFGGLAVQAQIRQPDPDTTAKHFLIVASIGNLQEVSSGQLATQQAKSSDVKSFGQMMVKDHGMAEQELLALAKSKHIALPPAATGGIQSDPLLKNSGENFDKMYVHTMVAGHGNKVQAFENYADTGKDPEVKAYAQKMLPILKAHLAEVKAIEKQLTAPAK